MGDETDFISSCYFPIVSTAYSLPAHQTFFRPAFSFSLCQDISFSEHARIAGFSVASLAALADPAPA
jgi:hypothetical protein